MTSQFQCPFCGVAMEAGLHPAEFEVQCPACQQNFVVEPPPAPVRVQAVAVLARHLPPPESGLPVASAHSPSPAAAQRVHRRIIIRKTSRHADRRAKMAIVSMMVGTPLIIGGLLWGGHWLRERQGAVPERKSAQELFVKVKEQELNFLEQQAEQQRIDNDRWERKHKEITEKEEREEAARIQERREFLKALMARALFNGDEALAEEAVREFEAAEKEVVALYSDGIIGNEPGNPREHLEQLFLTRLAVNKKLNRWMQGRLPADFSGVFGPRGGAVIPGRPAADPNSIQGQLMSGKYRSTGTGFWVSRDGWLLTNAHVTGTATSVDLRDVDGKSFTARVVKKDPAKDLALLKVDTSPATWLHISPTEAPIGWGVFTIGFPRPLIQGVEPKFTDGRISSLSGMLDNKDHYQCTVPIQPGNSGGALVEHSHGFVVGIVNARLGSSGAPAAGPAPENVGYAIKGGVIRTFIETVPEARTILAGTGNDAKKITESEAIDNTRKASLLILVK